MRVASVGYGAYPLGSSAVGRYCFRPGDDAETRRAVAQLGSAPRSGRGGRRFKSSQPDQKYSLGVPVSTSPGSSMAERRPVKPTVEVRVLPWGPMPTVTA